MYLFVNGNFLVPSMVSLRGIDIEMYTNTMHAVLMNCMYHMPVWMLGNLDLRSLV